MASGSTPHQRAHTAGASGRSMPPGIAAQADQDPLIDAAHDAGRNGVAYDDFASSNGLKAKKSAPRAPRAPRGPRSTSRPARVPRPTPAQPFAPFTAGQHGVAGTAAGILVGAVFYALVLSVIDYGASGPKLWFAAKFLNEAAPAPAAK